MASTSKTDRLIELVHTLPSELFKEIYDLTFALPRCGALIDITKSYKPPSTHQVNHETRKILAERYYHGDDINIANIFESRDAALLGKWLAVFATRPNRYTTLITLPAVPEEEDAALETRADCEADLVRAATRHCCSHPDWSINLVLWCKESVVGTIIISAGPSFKCGFPK